MPQQKSYAIRCSTEEQARECEKNNYTRFANEYDRKELLKMGFEVISYDEAISLGLWGEKNYTADEQMEINDMLNEEPQKVEPVRESPSEDEYSIEQAEKDIQEDIGISKYAMGIPSEDIVKKIVKEWIDTHGEQRAIYWREMEKILKKFLSK